MIELMFTKKMPLWFFILFFIDAATINRILKWNIDAQLYNNTHPYLAWLLTIPTTISLVFVLKKLRKMSDEK